MLRTRYSIQGIGTKAVFSAPFSFVSARKMAAALARAEFPTPHEAGELRDAVTEVLEALRGTSRITDIK
jgi:hypothetical protein